MSSDYYISLSYVVSQPNLFELKGAVNGSTESRLDAVTSDDPDYEWINSVFEPVLMCRFGFRDGWNHSGWRCVDVIDGKQLHICCSGMFRTCFLRWLDELRVPYESAE